MENMNQPMGAPSGESQSEYSGIAQGQAQAQIPGQMGGQPQPGGMYQYVPGAGFVHVPSAGMQSGMGMQPGMGMQSDAGMQPGMGAADASAQSGMFGQGTPEGAQPKFDQNKFGQMYGVIGDIMNGEADPAKIMGLFQESGGDFWKGALVGAAAVFLLNNDAVKGAVAGTFGSMFGKSSDITGVVTPDEQK